MMLRNLQSLVGTLCVLSTVCVVSATLAEARSPLTEPSAQETVRTSDSLGPSSNWQIDLLTYAWVPGLDGKVSVAGRTVPVSESVGDSFESLVEHFKFAFTGHIEARRGRLVLIGDLMYVALEDDNVRSQLVGPGEIRFQQGIGELGAAFTVIDETFGAGGQRVRIEPLAGIRGYYFNIELDFPFAGIDRSGSEKWADGFVGVQSLVDFTDRLGMYARFDIGAGGSDRVWNLILAGKWRVTDHATLYAGYRWLDIDYSDGPAFEFDVRMAGPFVGFGWSF